MKLLIIKKFSTIIIKNYNCIKCHNIFNNKLIPSFLEISNKYKNINKKYLYKKIKYGSKNVWGNNIMPSFKIKKEYIYKIILWILNIKNY